MYVIHYDGEVRLDSKKQPSAYASLRNAKIALANFVMRPDERSIRYYGQEWYDNAMKGYHKELARYEIILYSPAEKIELNG